MQKIEERKKRRREAKIQANKFKIDPIGSVKKRN